MSRKLFHRTGALGRQAKTPGADLRAFGSTGEAAGLDRRDRAAQIDPDDFLRYDALVMIRSILIGIGTAFALAACSSLPAPRPHSRLAATQAGCVRGTDGLMPSKSPCTTFGSSYSQRQIRQTGHTNLARALQSLDPDITSTGTP